MNRRRVMQALIAGAALGLSACGTTSNSSSGTSTTSSSGTSTTSSSGLSTTSAAGSQSSFDKAVADASKPIGAWPGPTAPVTPARRKTIVVVTCSPQGAGCVAAAQGATAAGKVLGWTVRTITGNGSPQGWNAGILNAISQKADGIILDAVPPALVGDAVAKARNAHIPLVSVFNPKVGASAGVFSYVTPDHEAQGVAMANWVAADSKGKAKVVLVEDNEFPELVERVNGFTSQLAKCTGCSIVAKVSSQIGTMAQKLSGAVTSVLQAHPDATYVISQYDSNAMFAGQGVRAAGKQTSVKVGGYEGDPQALAAIKSDQGQAATVADPTQWMGWQAMDELARAFAGKPAADAPTPWRLFTTSNVPTGTWGGDLDYQSKFRGLWGAP